MKTKRNTKKIKHLLVPILVLLVLVFAGGCQGAQDPTTTANSFLTALSRADVTSAQKYVQNQYLNSVVSQQLKQEAQQLLAALKNKVDMETTAAIYTNLTNLLAQSKWEFGEVKATNTTAAIPVTLTTIDLGAILSQVLAAENCASLTQLGQKLLASQSLESTVQTVDRVLKQPAPALQTKAFTLNMSKKEKQWLINDNLQLYNALTNGLFGQAMQLLPSQ